MNACCVKRRDDSRKVRGVAAWLVPGGLLMLMPKCPVCLAGYVAAATGLGLSVSTVSGLRTILITLCCLSLAFLTLRLLLRRKPSSNPTIP